VENECTLHNSIVLAIFVPKIIKVGEYLTKFWQKQFWLFFETRCIQGAANKSKINQSINQSIY